jgi:hypothetical protein
MRAPELSSRVLPAPKAPVLSSAGNRLPSAPQIQQGPHTQPQAPALATRTKPLEVSLSPTIPSLIGLPDVQAQSGRPATLRDWNNG